MDVEPEEGEMSELQKAVNKLSLQDIADLAEAKNKNTGRDSEDKMSVIYFKDLCSSLLWYW